MKKTSKIVNRVVKEYESGKLSSFLAKKYNVCSKTILNWVISKNGKTRPKSFYKKYSFDYNFFDVIDSEEKAYFLGFLFADGCYYKRYNKICIELNSKDINILKKIKKLIKSTYPISINTKQMKSGKYKEYASLYLHDLYFSKRCEELGIKERKSLILEFPDVKDVPKDLIRHFIRGYFDGDGSFTVNLQKRRVYGSIVSSEKFIFGLKSILEDVLGHKFGSIVKDGKVYKISFSGCFLAKKLFDFIYKDAKISLNRKRKIIDLFYKKVRTLQKRKNSKSKYLGVSFETKSGRFHASFWDKLKKKYILIASFVNEIDAAKAYDLYCIQNKINLHKLNFS